MPTLSRIAIYPLKSFDPILVNETRVLDQGALEFDRRFAFVDAAGEFLNAKRTALVHSLRVDLDPNARTLRVQPRTGGESWQWSIDQDRSQLERWFSDYFSLPLSLVENDQGGFPDDDVATGPTVVSTETLQAVAEWFPGIAIDQVRLRFRANLEISGGGPFWEDRLFGSGDTARAFRLGDVVFAGTNPCQRCVVPTRDPATGAVWPEFAKQFSQHRADQLPEWAARDRFNHFYRLSVNTRLLVRNQARIAVGDELEPVMT